MQQRSLAALILSNINLQSNFVLWMPNGGAISTDKVETLKHIVIHGYYGVIHGYYGVLWLSKGQGNCHLLQLFK